MADVLLAADNTLTTCPVCVASPLRHVRGADYSRSFLDVADAHWTRGPRLIQIADAARVLTPSQFVVFQFGVDLAQLIQRTERDESKDEFFLAATISDSSSSSSSRKADVTLRLAHALPPLARDEPGAATAASSAVAAVGSRNAFRNSFHFDAEKRVIYVRKERVQSIGGFALVVVHCLAHIEVGWSVFEKEWAGVRNREMGGREIDRWTDRETDRGKNGLLDGQTDFVLSINL